MKRAAWIAAALLPLELHGTGADDNTRPTPPPEARFRDKPVEAAPRRAEGVIEDQDQVLLESLAGLAIAPDAAMALRLQSRTRRGTSVEGFPPDETAAIRRIAEAYLGKPVTLAGLNRLLEALEAESRARGFLLRRVSYPAQEITSGVVALRMGPATVGRVRLADRPAFGTAFAARSFRTRPGGVLDEARLLDDLDWLNENPLRRASISHAPAAGDDALDLALRLRSPRSWRVYGGIDNQLSESLGDERLYLGFQHGDLFGLDHRLTGQVTTALQADALLGASLVHEIPLAGRRLLEISGGYTASETDVAGPLDQSGEFTRVSLGHRMLLPRWHGIAHSWNSAMEFRNNDYLFPDESSATVRFFQLAAGWQGRRPDRLGSTGLEVKLLYNPGRGVLGSEDADFIALGADGAESLILRADLERGLRMGAAGALHARLRAQWADAELLSSDQLSAGGMTRVRGFDEVVGYASNGLLANIEWRSPAWRHASTGELLGVLFVDGALLDRDAASDPSELLSAGFGCRGRWGERIYGRLDCGFPLECPDGVDSSPLIHFAVGFNW
jgi:hemolysin activation/secretion protein